MTAEIPLTVVTATTEQIARLAQARWGFPLITPWGTYTAQDLQGLVALEASREVGLVTFVNNGNKTEIVSLDAFVPSQGVGPRLLAMAELQAARNGAREIWLCTTNDNLRALSFYPRFGYRLWEVHRDAMEVVRRLKPGVSKVGLDGIPLQDVITFRKALSTDPKRQARSASPFEDQIGFSRAVRAGRTVEVSGTAPIGPDGTTVSPGDVGAQARRCLEILRSSLDQVGVPMSAVVRTRVMLVSREGWGDVAMAHREVFGDIRPATTFVLVAGFLDPEWLVEIEASAVADEEE